MTAGKRDYYSEGSVELATETPLTVTRLETRRKLTKNSTRLVIALVGLPARGKSFVSRKILYYLQWSGCKCKIFNVGRYRREAYANLQQADHDPAPHEGDVGVQPGSCDANFFDSHNAEAAALREKVAEIALIDMLKWLDEEDEEDDLSENDLPGMRRSSSATSTSSTSSLGTSPRLSWKQRVAIFDATNSTDKRRRWILEMCTAPERRRGKPTGVVFVESLCDDQELLEENYHFKTLNSPDYSGMSQEEAMQDLRNRVQKYEEQYETIRDDSISFIKVFNLSTKLLCNHIYGRMAKELVPALMAWHIGTRPVFLCRPGQTLSGIYVDSEDYLARNKTNLQDPRFVDMNKATRRRSVFGDSLGPQGKAFRDALLNYCYDEAHSFMFKRASVRDMAYTGTSMTGLAPAEAVVPSCEGTDEPHDYTDPFQLRILTSTMPRAIETVNWAEFDFLIHQMSNLNPLDKGDFAGLELDEIQRMNPEWFAKLEKDPFDTRFPGGESYRDLIRRLSSVVIDIEQEVIPTLVVSHVSVLQVLIAYFRNSPIESCMGIEVPLHTVLKFTPVRGGGWMETRIPLIESLDNSANSLHRDESVSEISALDENTGSSSPIWGDHLKRMQLTENVV